MFHRCVAECNTMANELHRNWHIRARLDMHDFQCSASNSDYHTFSPPTPNHRPTAAYLSCGTLPCRHVPESSLHMCRSHAKHDAHHVYQVPEPSPCRHARLRPPPPNHEAVFPSASQTLEKSFVVTTMQPMAPEFIRRTFKMLLVDFKTV